MCIKSEIKREKKISASHEHRGTKKKKLARGSWLEKNKKIFEVVKREMTKCSDEVKTQSSLRDARINVKRI